MMKTVKKSFMHIICVLVAAAIMTCGLAACGGGGTNKVNVTFDYNYEGAPQATVQQVDNGDVAIEPEDEPTRALYKFEGWYADKEGSQSFDFEEALYSDVTVYAKWKQTQVEVTFNYNYTGAPSDKVAAVDIKGTVAQPTDNLEREGYYFTSWYTTAACDGTPFDFSTKIEAALTLYAGWEADTGDSYKVSYMWNYEGNTEAAYIGRVKKNGKITTLYQAVREGYYLGGWYTDAACTEMYDNKNRVNENLTLYAGWLKVNTFEAEYTDVSQLVGKGYSGDQSTVGCIVNAEKKRGSMNASNNAYIGWMYLTGNTITFEIESDAAVDNAVLAVRLSAEFYDVTFNSTNFTVKVNGNKLEYPTKIVMTGVPPVGNNGYRPFETYVLDTVSLKQGLNKIELIISNSDNPNPSGSGTMGATAPLIDCIYLYTNANLTWDPIYSNICNKNTD